MEPSILVPLAEVNGNQPPPAVIFIAHLISIEIDDTTGNAIFFTVKGDYLSAIPAATLLDALTGGQNPLTRDLRPLAP